MIVKMNTLAAGPEFAANPGDLKEVAEDFGQALIAAGHAELAEVVVLDPDPDAAAPPAATRERAVAGKRAKR